MSESSPISADVAGVTQRFIRRAGAALWEASQWEQAFFDLKAQNDAVIASLSNQIEALQQQLAAGSKPAETDPPGSET